MSPQRKEVFRRCPTVEGLAEMHSGFQCPQPTGTTGQPKESRGGEPLSLTLNKEYLGKGLGERNVGGRVSLPAHIDNRSFHYPDSHRIYDSADGLDICVFNTGRDHRRGTRFPPV